VLSAPCRQEIMSDRPGSDPYGEGKQQASGQPQRFADRMWRDAESRQSWVCLGLDLDTDQLPTNIPRTCGGSIKFLKNTVDMSIDIVAAFKMNLAFYLALGVDGMRIWDAVARHIDGRAIMIADGKFGDVPSSAAYYRKASFDVLQADAVTVDPYGGWDTVELFAEDPAHGVFVWTRSSNPGADAIQHRSNDSEPVFVTVARWIHSRSGDGNVGAVVGATRAGDVSRVRALAPCAPLLVPGVGRQGGDLDAVVRAGFGDCPAGVLVNAGRAALWASSSTDYAQATRRSLVEMRDRINYARCA